MFDDIRTVIIKPVIELELHSSQDMEYILAYRVRTDSEVQ
jgi:hypothetical protein